MNADDKYTGPCGKACKTCMTKEDCPITLEQWHDWLTVDLMEERSRDDASTPARKLYYMQYINDEEELEYWIDRLLVDCWNETRRDDYHYRYPIPADKLRPFLDDIFKKHLSYRERQIVSVCLGLDTGERLSRCKVGELFNMSQSKVRAIYEGAVDKLTRAIIKDRRWRRRGLDGRYMA